MKMEPIGCPETSVKITATGCVIIQNALLGYYAASSGKFLPTFRDNLYAPSSDFQNKKFLNHEDGTDRLS